MVSQLVVPGQRLDKTIVVKKKNESSIKDGTVRDFQDFIHLLNKQAVEYRVVGGYASALHGKPRHTGDLGIWVNIS